MSVRVEVRRGDGPGSEIDLGRGDGEIGLLCGLQKDLEDERLFVPEAGVP